MNNEYVRLVQDTIKKLNESADPYYPDEPDAEAEHYSGSAEPETFDIYEFPELVDMLKRDDLENIIDELENYDEDEIGAVTETIIASFYQEWIKKHGSVLMNQRDINKIPQYIKNYDEDFMKKWIKRHENPKVIDSTKYMDGSYRQNFGKENLTGGR